MVKTSVYQLRWGTKPLQVCTVYFSVFRTKLLPIMCAFNSDTGVCVWVGVKSMCVFPQWPLNDPVACLSSVDFNLSSLVSVSSHMPSLILHRCLSLWIHLLESLSFFSTFFSLFQALSVTSSCLPSFRTSWRLGFFFCSLVLFFFPHKFPTQFAASVSVFLIVSHCSNVSASVSSLFLHLCPLALFLSLWCLQQQTTGALIVSNGETLTSDLGLTKTARQQYTQRVMTGTKNLRTSFNF